MITEDEIEAGFVITIVLLMLVLIAVLTISIPELMIPMITSFIIFCAAIVGFGKLWGIVKNIMYV